VIARWTLPLPPPLCPVGAIVVVGAVTLVVVVVTGDVVVVVVVVTYVTHYLGLHTRSHTFPLVGLHTLVGCLDATFVPHPIALVWTTLYTRLVTRCGFLWLDGFALPVVGCLWLFGWFGWLQLVGYTLRWIALDSCCCYFTHHTHTTRLPHPHTVPHTRLGWLDLPLRLPLWIHIQLQLRFGYTRLPFALVACARWLGC